MIQFINFVTHNIETIVFVLICTVFFTALSTVFYFFVYSYIVNKRLRHPEKKYRLKLIMPRFACIIFAVLSILCSLKMTNKVYNIGAYNFTTFWQGEVAFVQPCDSVGVNFTKEELEQNPDFERYTQHSDYFDYTLYYNKSFNGLIDINSKNCEYVLFADYIGKDKNLNGKDYIDISAENISGTDYYGTGAGYSLELGDESFSFYGCSDSYNKVAVSSIIYKKDHYDKMADIEDEEYNEEDYQYLRENVYFELEKKAFTTPRTKIIGN